MTGTCEFCGTSYSRPKSIFGRFCSKRCAYDARRTAPNTTRKMRRDPSHPLAGKTNIVVEYRALLFEQIGWGPHPCHWCSRPINWKVGMRGGSGDALVVDHVDNNPLNNNLRNLVPSCQSCNGVRSRAVRDDEVFITRKNESRLRAQIRTCESCAEEFAAALIELRNGKGRFCSRSCARKQPRRS